MLIISLTEARTTWEMGLWGIILVLLTDVSNVEKRILIVDGAIPSAGAIRN